MTNRWWTTLTGLLLLPLLVTGCTTQSAGGPTAAPVQPEVVYAAIGASETYGVGANDRYRQAWPQVFYNDLLPPSSVLYNFGIPGTTTAEALRDEVPVAVGVHPTVVTVWLNVNDLIQGVSPQAYAAQLQQLVHALRRGGQTRVLVANTPDLRELPAYQACLPNPPAGGPQCLIPTGLVPSPGRVAAAIDAYNGVIAEVVTQEGATLVDLHAGDALMAQHPEWLSSDGFHPNGLGYAAIARVFEDAYRKIAPA
jgi:lysophospholipase L1-like esterase